MFLLLKCQYFDSMADLYGQIHVEVGHNTGLDANLRSKYLEEPWTPALTKGTQRISARKSQVSGHVYDFYKTLTYIQKHHILIFVEFYSVPIVKIRGFTVLYRYLRIAFVISQNLHHHHHQHNCCNRHCCRWRSTEQIRQ